MTSPVLALGPDGFGSYEVKWSEAGPSLHSSPAQADVLLVPGFVDIHIHGAFGVDFMSASEADLLQLCSGLEAEGYEGFLPTTVTASVGDVKKAIAQRPGHPMILGFHLEGPVISPAHPGAQPLAWISTADAADSEWQEVFSDPRLKLITMAPEIDGAAKLIRQLYEKGKTVSMGHSDATYAQASSGFLQGARNTTHTFNAMRGFHHREAGLAGFALLEDRLYAELIYDRLHVCKEAAALLVRNKPADKLIAVSDSSMATRTPPGETVTMWGHECITKPGEVRLASNGALAGSAITLLDAFGNLAEDFGPEVAIRACCLNPRTALGLRATPTTWLTFDSKFALADRWAIKSGSPS